MVLITEVLFLRYILIYGIPLFTYDKHGVG